MQALYLVSKLVLHIFLDTTQHERLQYHVQAPDLVFVDVVLAFILSMTFDIFGEPFHKFVVRIEQSGHYEVQQCPEFCSFIKFSKTFLTHGRQLTMH